MKMSVRIILVISIALAAYGIFTRAPSQASTPATRNKFTKENSSSSARTLASTVMASFTKATTKVSDTPDFRELATNLGGVSADPEGREAKAVELAQSLSNSDAQDLASLSLNPQESHQARFLAVYLLSLQADRFAGQLEKIACTPDQAAPAQHAEPHSFAELQIHNDRAVRAQAILALDSRSTHTAEEQRFFEQTARNPACGSLINSLAAVAAIGAAKGRPQVEQYINSSIGGILNATSND